MARLAPRTLVLACLATAALSAGIAAPVAATPPSSPPATTCPFGTLAATVKINPSRTGYSAPTGPGRFLLTRFLVTGPVAPFDPAGVMQVAQVRTTAVTTIYKTFVTTTVDTGTEEGVVTWVDESGYPGTQSYMEAGFVLSPPTPPATDYSWIVDEVKVCAGLGGFGEDEEPEFTFLP